jgi:PAS domain S-box-containing protein
MEPTDSPAQARATDGAATQTHGDDLARMDTPALLRAIVENSGSVIFLKDAAGRYLLVNRHFEEAFQIPREKIVGRTDEELFAAPVATAFRTNDLAVMRGGRAIEFEEVAPYGDGPHTSIVVKFPWIQADGSVGGVGGIAVDITERKRAEAERLQLEAKVLQAQKLESLGVLAGGIAHDFNNLLSAIMASAGLALRLIPSLTPGRHAIEQIEVITMRAAELVRQMLAYAGKGRVASERVALSALVREMTGMLGSVVSKKATLATNLAADLPAVQGDPTQLRQVVMNLITNASEALGKGSGTIRVRTGCLDAGADDLRSTFLDTESPPGRYVFLEVEDTGSGMDAATLARMFDPFFTTKFTGRGLGLAAVLGIVRAHRGTIQVRSTPGTGTTCRVLLPALADAERPAAAGAAPGVRWEGRGTVLVVDDEPSVRRAAREVLESAGYAVHVAGDGREALDVIHARRAELSAVLLDVTMPELHGDELLAQLREALPKAIVVVMSGHDPAEVEQRFAGQRVEAFLPKPFRADALLAAVGRALAAAKA